MANFHQFINCELLDLTRVLTEPSTGSVEPVEPIETPEPRGLSSHDFAIVNKFDVVVGDNILVGKLITGWYHVQLVFTVASMTFEGIGVNMRAYRQTRKSKNTEYYPWIKKTDSVIYLVKIDDWQRIICLHDVSKVSPTARNPDSGLAAEEHAAFRALFL